jgi:hypothetical protein
VRFSTPEQYLEKIGINLLGAKGVIKAGLGKGSVSFGQEMLDAMAAHPWITAGSLTGLGALGATGMLEAAGGGRPGETFSYKINKGLNSLLDRIRYDEVAGDAFAKQIGSQSAEALMGLATDMAGKTVDTLKSVTMDSPARNAIFSALRKEDPIIAQADMKTLNDAFHTMANVAPSLSTDKNAVKSVLRLAATSGGGLDYQTIKGLADAETSLKKARGEMR